MARDCVPLRELDLDVVLVGQVEHPLVLDDVADEDVIVVPVFLHRLDLSGLLSELYRVVVLALLGSEHLVDIT